MTSGSGLVLFCSKEFSFQRLIFGSFKTKADCVIHLPRKIGISVRADTSTNDFDLSNFLENGGFIRLSETPDCRWLVWQGQAPEAVSASAPIDFKNSEKFHIFTSDFFHRNKSFKVPQKVFELSSADFKKLLSQPLATDEETDSRVWNPPNIELFHQSFTAIQKQIFAGEIKKALPVVLSESPGPVRGREKGQALLAMFDLPSGLHPYGQWDLSGGFMGATPEVLFALDQNQLTTMALAGTTPSQTDDAAFLNDEKETSEHQFVVQHIFEILNQMQAEIHIESRRLLKLPKLKHIHTPIRAQFAKAPEFLSLIEKMHPTAALGVFPKRFIKHPEVDALAWVETLPEQKSRKSHGAPFSVIWPGGKALTLVGIRQVFWDQKKSVIGAGCGIVADSVFEKEWNELLLKIQSVKGLLGWVD